VAKRQSGKPVKKSTHSTEPVSSEEKIARLLGMIVIKEIESKGDQATLLRSVGFDVAEVAAMLGMSENHVKVATHHGRKKRQKTPKRGSKKK
jgi:DNA-directed RNA polymerase specialized sigma24 family protein